MDKEKIVKHGITGVKWSSILVVALVLLLLLVQLIHYTSARWVSLQDNDKLQIRDAVAFPKTDEFGDSFAAVDYLDQGWTPKQSLWFYSTSQGSDLLPYDFFVNLEQANSSELFRSPQNMNHYRYLVQEKGDNNPDALPVGMVANTYRGKKYVGYTCAACHTAQVNVTATAGERKGQNVGLRIDGGPAMADMENFLGDLAAALQATKNNPDKQARFLKAVTNSHYSEQQALADLQDSWQSITDYNTMNAPVAADGQKVTYGYARLDAFGRIYNRVLENVIDPEDLTTVLDRAHLMDDPGKHAEVDKLAHEALQEDAPEHLIARAEKLGLRPYRTAATVPGDKDSDSKDRGASKTLFNSPNAPVSYPFLWDTPQHDHVQWNALADNAGVGPLGRNAGEVIGVFGTLEWHETHNSWFYSFITGQGLHSTTSVNYQSSVNVSNLRLLESQLADLHSPKWPAKYLGAPDPEKSARGRVLYDSYCVSCHARIVSDSPERRIVAHMDSIDAVKTDPTMANNSVQYQGASGMLEHQYIDVGVGNILLDDHAPVAALLTKATKGVVLTTPDSDDFVLWRWIKRLFDFILTLSDNVITTSTIKDGNYQPDTTAAPFASLRAYKGRPLNGIWATAPYLHNGSVPNLYLLLKPETERPKTFKVGSRQFDPLNVGFKYDGYDGFVFDTSIPGNANSGHEYGTGGGGDDKPALTDAQRWDLVEYLKTL